MSTTLSADNVVGQSMYAKASVKGYKVAGMESTVNHLFNVGDYIGEVYSYITVNGVVWWAFQGSDGSNFYVQHETGKLSLPSLDAAQSSGIVININSSKSIDQQVDAAKQAEADKGFFDKLSEYGKQLLNVASVVLLIVGLFKAVMYMRNEYNRK